MPACHALPLQRRAILLSSPLPCCPALPLPLPPAEKSHFAELAVDAVLRLKGSTNLDAIQIIKKPGGTIKVGWVVGGSGQLVALVQPSVPAAPLPTVLPAPPRPFKCCYRCRCSCCCCCCPPLSTPSATPELPARRAHALAALLCTHLLLRRRLPMCPLAAPLFLCPSPLPPLQDSFLDEGFILDKRIGVGQPKRIENAKILVANTGGAGGQPARTWFNCVCAAGVPSLP